MASLTPSNIVMDAGRVKRIPLEVVNPGTKISNLELMRLLDTYPTNAYCDMITECSEKCTEIHHMGDVPGGLAGLDHLLLFHLECEKCEKVPTLCSWCQHLRLRHLIACENWSVGRIYLGHIRDIAARRCSFCSFITQTIRRAWEAAGFHGNLQAVDKSLACHIQLDRPPGHPYLLLQIDSHYPPDFPKRNRGKDFWLRMEAQVRFQTPQGYAPLPPERVDPYPLFSGKRRYQEPDKWKNMYAKNTTIKGIDGAPSNNSISLEIETTPAVGVEANWSVIKRWIHSCESQHTDSCDFHSLHIRLRAAGIFVIDVKDRCVVPAPQDCRYVALSYVWGVPKPGQNRFTATLANIEDLKKPGALSSTLLPRTINDAILVCKELGERYLWVDSLCIIQDDFEQKRRCIDSMTAIFVMAIFTIIAASGSDADAGLPGTKETPRPVQSRITLQDLELTSILPDIYETVFSSTWNERGWTYQEEWGVVAEQLYDFVRQLLKKTLPNFRPIFYNC